MLSGNTLEFYEYEKPIFYNFTISRREESNHNEQKKDKDDNQESSRDRSRQRSKKMIKRLVYSNFGMWHNAINKPYVSKSLTLTFRDNILTPKEGNPRFTLFVKRLNYILFKSKKSIIQYLVVIEFQPESGRVHYHALLFNLPYIKRIIDVFNQTWDQGYLWIKKTGNERKTANYITKYITKENDDRLIGEKSYFRSRGLKHPIVCLNENFLLQVRNVFTSLTPLYKNSFENEYTGKTNYFMYNIQDNHSLKNLILNKSNESLLYSNQ